MNNVTTIDQLTTKDKKPAMKKKYNSKVVANNHMTLPDSTDFRSIAALMTQRGFKMNHATARNILLRATRKVLEGVAKELLGKSLSDQEVEKLLNDQETFKTLQQIFSQVGTK